MAELTTEQKARIEEVREALAEIIMEDDGVMSSLYDSVKKIFTKKDSEGNPMVGIIDDEQSLPHIEKYKRNAYNAHDTENDIYGKGQCIANYNMIDANFVRIIPYPEED